MSESELTDGRLLVRRTAKEKEPLIRRLNKVEGQIRGLRAMLEQDRYCGDELQQIKACISALREVGHILVEQHVSESAVRAGQSKENSIVKDLMLILREAIRL